MEPVSSREPDPVSAHDAASEPLAPPAASRRAARRPFWRDLQAWLRDIFVSIAIAAVVIVFLYQPVKVEGTSMLPHLADKERIFVNKFLYNFDAIDRGDVVVFRFPIDPSKSYIKRVVGLPGDAVEIVGGEVYLNGAAYREPYVLPRYRDRGSYPKVVVPAGEYYVLGDHRNTSNDSRTWGTVAQEYVTGKAVFSYWPPERFGVLE